jgi:hypothetical protein
MNANENVIQASKPALIPAVEREEKSSRGMPVEAREFENLLQRAMEILSARAERAMPHTS